MAEGQIPDLDGLLEEVSSAEERAKRYGARAEEVREALMPDRITPLDPSRPAQDLLEDLLDGIRGCWLLYRAEADDEDDENLDGGSDDDERDERLDQRFFDAVRASALANGQRLT